ncbi:uncharacterized protein LOC120143860 [Hibiscus syriacus]|uniref:uncharacterized protein LOC120143860 n=1 Tax=Hibiscus syriacus TaxID=106335 RepID=UPI0019217740|nr:uncharacterized protein LOC120143860 [Hibiscus syriacus]
MCNASLESALHAIKNCPKLKPIFSLSGLPQVIVDWEGISCLDWLKSTLPKLNREGFDLFLMLLWNVWNRRNKWINNTELQPDINVILKAWNLLSEFKQVSNLFACLSRETPPRRIRKWCKLAQGLIKINVDGAFYHKSHKVDIGVVVRDSNGMALGGMTTQIDPPDTVESTEAYAFTQAIRLLPRMDGTKC